jgi:VWFA-related protein
MSLRRCVVPIAGLLLLAGVQTLAQPPAAEELQPAFRLRTDAVVVDVVVRDDGKRPATGLTAADFEVREDGVPQTITSFTVRERRSTTTPRAGAEAGPARSGTAMHSDASTGDTGVVAIVFDQLTPEARRLAYLAARSFVGEGPDAPGVVGVFRIGREELVVVQNYTREYRRIRTGVDLAGTYQVLPFDGAQSQVRDLQAGGLGALTDNVPPPLAAGAGPPSSGSTAGPPDDALQMMQLRMLLAFDMADRDRRSGVVSEALLSVVASMADVPGRKSLVLLSEGLDQGPALRGRLQDVVNAANRANVAIYTIDAAGLRVGSPLAGVRQETGFLPSDGPMLRGVERAETIMMSTPTASLGRLSRDTGGAYIENTNDGSRIFTRLREDMDNHYVLTYVSTNPTYDRKYRRIGVKVSRPGVSVSARHGYYAIPPRAGQITHAWEASAVGALEASRVPNAFPVQLERLVFPTADPERSVVPLLLQTSGRELQYDVDDGRFRAEAVFLIRIRDINGQVLAKASDQYVLEGKATDTEASRAQTMLFYRQVHLPPGTYVVEAVVHDVLADRASVRVGSLEVPRMAAALPKLGSVFLVQHAQRGVTSRSQVDSPLLHDGVLLYPNVSRVVPRGQANDVTFAFSVLPAGVDVEKARVELRSGLRLVGESDITLNAPGSDGRIQQIASLPTTDLAPGTYDLRVKLGLGGVVLTRTTRFTVTP